METLLTIKERLTDIANDSSLSGPVIDGLILLLSESVYRGQVGNVTELLERSFSRCRFVNSAITHAFDRCYSVFRGQNQMFKLQNVLPIETKTVSKFEIACNVGAYRLVYADNYTFSSLHPVDEVRLILCTDVETEVTTVNSQNRIRVKFDSSNISTHVSVSRDFLNEYEDVSSSEYFADAVNGVEKTDGTTTSHDFPLWVGTRENYSLCVSCLQDTGFISTENVRIKFLPYLEDEIDVSQIPSLPGFISTINNLDDQGNVINQDEQLTESNYISLGRLDRESNISTIFKNANAVFLSSGVIKSYNDLEKLILERYGNIIGSVSIRFDFSSFERQVNGTTTKKPYIFVSYADKSESATLRNIAGYTYSGAWNVEEWDEPGLSAEDLAYYGTEAGKSVKPFKIRDFTDEARIAYYIEEDIVFVPAIKFSIPNLSLLNNYASSYIDEEGNKNAITWDADQTYSGKFRLKIYYTSITQPSKEATAVLNTYKYTFFNKFNISRLMADLQDVDGIKFVEVFCVYLDNSGKEIEIEFPPISIDLGQGTLSVLKSSKLVRKLIQDVNFEMEFISFDKYLATN